MLFGCRLATASNGIGLLMPALCVCQARVIQPVLALRLPGVPRSR